MIEPLLKMQDESRRQRDIRNQQMSAEAIDNAVLPSGATAQRMIGQNVMQDAMNRAGGALYSGLFSGIRGQQASGEREAGLQGARQIGEALLAGKQAEAGRSLASQRGGFESERLGQDYINKLALSQLKSSTGLAQQMEQMKISEDIAKKVDAAEKARLWNEMKQNYWVAMQKKLSQPSGGGGGGRISAPKVSEENKPSSSVQKLLKDLQRAMEEATQPRQRAAAPRRSGAEIGDTIPWMSSDFGAAHPTDADYGYDVIGSTGAPGGDDLSWVLGNLGTDYSSYDWGSPTYADSSYSGATGDYGLDLGSLVLDQGGVYNLGGGGYDLGNLDIYGTGQY